MRRGCEPWQTSIDDRSSLTPIFGVADITAIDDPSGAQAMLLPAIGPSEMFVSDGHRQRAAGAVGVDHVEARLPGPDDGTEIVLRIGLARRGEHGEAATVGCDQRGVNAARQHDHARRRARDDAGGHRHGGELLHAVHRVAAVETAVSREAERGEVIGQLDAARALPVGVDDPPLVPGRALGSAEIDPREDPLAVGSDRDWRRAAQRGGIVDCERVFRLLRAPRRRPGREGEEKSGNGGRAHHAGILEDRKCTRMLMTRGWRQLVAWWGMGSS